MQASAVRGFAGFDGDEPFFGRRREAVLNRVGTWSNHSKVTTRYPDVPSPAVRSLVNDSVERSQFVSQVAKSPPTQFLSCTDRISALSSVEASFQYLLMPSGHRVDVLILPDGRNGEYPIAVRYRGSRPVLAPHLHHGGTPVQRCPLCVATSIVLDAIVSRWVPVTFAMSWLQPG